MRGLQTKPEAGTIVRLTGVFLRSTGQIAGGEGEKRWRVVACDCRGCHDWEKPGSMPLVAVDEAHLCQSDPRGYEDIPPEERPKWRHIAAFNLEALKAKPKVEDYP